MKIEVYAVCPMCSRQLTLMKGTRINPNDGYTLFCPYYDCPAQEVMGHDTTPERAFNIIQQKFPKEKLTD
jgi:hypothetical protein